MHCFEDLLKKKKKTYLSLAAWPASAHSVCAGMMLSLCVSCYGERRGGWGGWWRRRRVVVGIWVVRGKGERRVGGGGGRFVCFSEM